MSGIKGILNDLIYLLIATTKNRVYMLDTCTCFRLSTIGQIWHANKTSPPVQMTR